MHHYSRPEWQHPFSQTSLHEVIRIWYLLNHGHVVPVFDRKLVQDQQDWCRTQLIRPWTSNEKILTDEQFREELTHRVITGDMGPSNKHVPFKLDIIKETVAAKSRKLGAQWGFEIPQTVKAIHNQDVEQELADALAMEISAEIDREILGTMNGWTDLAKRALSRSRPVWFFAFTDPRDATLFKLTWGGE